MPRSSKLCAVIVPESVQKRRDVLSASSDLVAHTPYPLGLSIHSWTDEQPVRRSLPLIFVSEEAARDRSPARHPMNGMGVRPGWYVIAQPGRFEVHVTHVKPEHYGLPWEDALEVELYVDGQYTHKRKVLIQSDERQDRTDVVFEGFVERRKASEWGSNERISVIRPFAFEKVSRGVECQRYTPTDAGTIHLRVHAGVVTAYSHSTRRDSNYVYAGKEVSEKNIAQQGSAMKVSRNTSSVVRFSTVSPIKVRSKRHLQEAEITVFVRERAWLRSRRLIGDNDQPLMYGVFRQLLKAVQSSDGRTQVVNEAANTHEGPLRKKRKIKEQMLLIEDEVPIQPGEVIDLT